jgi:Zn-dependent protease/predicted transcriptional regulator
MFGKKIPLFSLLGFKVSMDLTWIFLAALVTWSLASGLFPYYFPNLSTATYWWMGVIGALGLFISIVFHEFCHSLVARRFNLPMKGITLFIFGGVAEMEDEPSSPGAEFFMAIAGPLSSIVLAVVLYFVARLGRNVGWPLPVNAVVGYLAWLNMILAVFNLIPAFPLDGGRVLRSILWRVKGNARWATRVASGLGSGFGMFLVVVGIVYFLGGAFIQGVWYFLIGLFIRNASESSYKQILIRNALSGEEIDRFMKSYPVTVPTSITIDQLVNDYFYRYHYKMFPVSEGDGLLGCVTPQQVKEVPKEEWKNHTVKEVLAPCSGENTIAPHTDAMQALSLMNRTGNSRLLVVEGGRLLGIITLKDMLKFLSLKVDLESR